MTLNLIPERMRYLLENRTRAYLSIATLMPDGSPQATIMWFNLDGEHIVINTVGGFVKDRNLRRDPRVALIIWDPNDPVTYIQVRGEVAEITTKGGHAHIDALSQKYSGRDYGEDPQTVRVIYKIRPEHVYVN